MREKNYEYKDMKSSQDEKITVALPRTLVEQLIDYDPKTADLLGIEGFISAICQEWHGEEIIRKTKTRAEEVLFSPTKETEEVSSEKEKKQQPYIFQVRNHHHESCGIPPQFDNPPGAYLSYYENQFGEQNIFVYDYQTKEAFLYMGDAGWERPRRVIEGGMVPGLIYGQDEAAWLFACWMATHFSETMQMLMDSSKKGKKRR